MLAQFRPQFRRLSLSVLVSALLPALLLPATPSLAQTSAAIAVSAPVASTLSSNEVELVFVLDTTGSMGGLLEGAKTRIWGIVNEIMQKRSGMRVKVGLVAYRDRGDAYLTKVTPLTSNLDEVYAQLMGLRAEGGGDTPEDVRSAMQDGLKKVNWSQPSKQISQIMFLVGDAPPHDDYREIPAATETAKQALSRGIVVNTIQCGNIHDTTLPWRNIAQYGGGEYFTIAQDGGVQAIATPYDAELSSLGEKIGSTYMAYGSAEVREKKQARQATLESSVAAAAPAPAKAERALNKAINSSAYDEADLVQQIESGKTSLDKLKDADLPDALRKLKPEERAAKLAQIQAERKAAKEKILKLSKEREVWLAEQKRKSGKSKDGFDSAVSNALNRQIK